MSDGELDKHMPKLSEKEKMRIARGLYDKTIRAYISDADMRDLFLFLHSPNGLMTWPEDVFMQIGGIVADVKDCPSQRSWMPAKIRVIRKEDWKEIRELYKAIEDQVNEALELHRKHRSS